MMTKSLSMVRMIIATIVYQWRLAGAVVLGVATATGVITGALLVGDSMRGSLRSLTIERLGRTETIVSPGSFFSHQGIVSPSIPVAPLIFFPAGIAEAKSDEGRVRRAGAVQVIACDDRFWDLESTAVADSRRKDVSGIGDDEVVLNRSAASELGVQVGDRITVRLPADQAVPADSPLGRRDLGTEGLPRLLVRAIIDDRGLGRFAITPSQAAPQNVFLSREFIAETLDRNGQANLLLFDQAITADQLQVGLDDLGIAVRRITRSDIAEDSSPVFQYDSITSDRLLLPDLVVTEVIQEFGKQQVTPVTTYLANAIEKLDDDGQVVKSVPYSTITAIDSSKELPLDYTLPRDGDAPADAAVVPLVLNQWTANQLDATEGTLLRVAYYEPEVENGNEIERTFDAVVSSIVPLTEPARPYRRNREAVFDQSPTLYNDPDLTPLVPGVTDQESISDWDLPFTLTRKIAKADDDYWGRHRLTPKAFLPLDSGESLFGSRFGKTTGLRVDVSVSENVEALQSRLSELLKPHLESLGWSVQRVRERQLKASQGTTPFDGLFLSLSFFVIVSAVLLIVMLFRLGLIDRSGQLGTLLAAGWPAHRVRRLLLGEGAVIASLGAIVGVAGGVGYAIVVLAALRSWWVGAVTVPFLRFHWSVVSLVVGATSGWLVAMLAIFWTTRWLLRAQPQSLLRGAGFDGIVSDGSATRKSTGKANQKASRVTLGKITVTTAVMALVIAVVGAVMGGQAAAGGFVTSGMLLLVTSLMVMYGRLRRPHRLAEKQSPDQQSSLASYRLSQVASRNASRRPLQSVMTIGLMASASFLIIAINAFQLRPSNEGIGGFELIGQTSHPLYHDLNNQRIREETFGADEDELTGVSFLAMRLRLEQDVSCNNLYRATKPTVLGMPHSFTSGAFDLANAKRNPRQRFPWASHDDLADSSSPWALLEGQHAGTQADPIPVVIDQNTAMWSLQMLGGIDEVKSFEYEPGQNLHFRVVGLLANSVLQGKLMIGEQNFERAFPDISGYRAFLIDVDSNVDGGGANGDRSVQVSETLEDRLGDVGMDISPCLDVLSGLMAVQNTYLRTFQSLGALGLLLGMIGLAVTQLRSILERRKEMAVMRAVGFTRGRLSIMVLTETAALLLAGIGCGVVCSILAVVPYAWLSNIRPPLVEPLIMVIAIMVFGMLAGLVAVRGVNRISLLQSLRSE